MRRVGKSTYMKIVVAGEGGVGKTTLIESFRRGQFYDETTMTIAVQFHTMKFNVFDKSINLQIWDLGGQRHFLNMGVFSQYCRGAHAAILCFDISDFNTLEEIPRWLEVLPLNIPKLLIGTKADMAMEDEIEDIKSIVDPYLKKFKFDGFMISNVGDIESVQNIFKVLTGLTIEKGTIEHIPGLTPALVA